MRALVVEDYHPLRAAIAQALRGEGFAVDESGDGEEGAWFARGTPFDIIILDLGLPKLDGLEVLRQMRARGDQAHVLIVTARDRVEDRCAGLDAGADDYLVKPFAVPELLSRVRALLRRAYARKDPVLRIADLAIDTATHRVQRGSQDIELSQREYTLLEFLALRAGELVTREDIRSHLYDFRSESGSNVIDVYIGYLRKKIERDDLPRLLTTRRGHGYILGPA
ncbi:MAG TPA: DNA-binding response regulator [Planctomycetes bacterium]|nr:DNA-binding response regulator [Planctomycetota bacterium]